MPIDDFLKLNGMAKSELASELGYDHPQSLTNIDKAPSYKFMYLLLMRYPHLYVVYNEELARHEISLK